MSFKKPIIGYIAGFVGKMTVKHTWCKDCCDALGSTKITTVSSLILFKDKGGLFKPSLSVIQICEEAETKIQRMMNAQDGHLPKGKGMFISSVQLKSTQIIAAQALHLII